MCQKCRPLTLTRLESLHPLVYRIFDNGLFKVNPDLHQSLLRLSQFTYWLLVPALPLRN